LISLKEKQLLRVVFPIFNKSKTVGVKKRHEQKLVVLSFALFVALNTPFILIFDSSMQLLGIPVLYFYIFVVWLVAIIVTYIILKKYYE
tara:strand:- start:129 stop:395 length:267 start_codon:yes stop_codon:yes gene_type:complete